MKDTIYNLQTKQSTVVTLTSEEEAKRVKPDSVYWAELRSRRDQLLSSTDWRASSDLTLSDAWKKYRQDLRDLPANTSDPKSPTWPSEPS